MCLSLAFEFKCLIIEFFYVAFNFKVFEEMFDSVFPRKAYLFEHNSRIHDYCKRKNFCLALISHISTK